MANTAFPPPPAEGQALPFSCQTKGHVWTGRDHGEPGSPRVCGSCGTRGDLLFDHGPGTPAQPEEQRDYKPQVDIMTDDNPTPAELLEAWWMRVADNDFSRLRPKVEEYGSADIRIMGKMMQELIPGLDERQGQEAALGFYLLGKVARMFGAWTQAQDPSEDTYYDTTIYSIMARRIRRMGQWP